MVDPGAIRRRAGPGFAVRYLGHPLDYPPDPSSAWPKKAAVPRQSGVNDKVRTQEITAINLFQKILIPPTVCIIFMLVLSIVGYQSLDVQRQAIDELFNTLRHKHLQLALPVHEGPGRSFSHLPSHDLGRDTR
ncbi:MAG: hypothetical protein LK562_12830 [Candidatus Accumulibacter phosphatis]|nr:hypothetical protein [Candidatus Accumulibacter phosphatis]